MLAGLKGQDQRSLLKYFFFLIQQTPLIFYLLIQSNLDQDKGIDLMNHTSWTNERSYKSESNIWTNIKQTQASKWYQTKDTNCSAHFFLAPPD